MFGNRFGLLECFRRTKLIFGTSLKKVLLFIMARLD
jgi:hypothetical protein